MKKRGRWNKQAAFEMSITTVVVLVIAMVMLALGLVLVKNIFGGATSSVDIINDKVKSQINNLFQSTDSNVIVKLGADNKAKVRAGTPDFGVAIAARTCNGKIISKRDRIKLTLSLPKEGERCLSSSEIAGGKSTLYADRYDGDTAYFRVKVSIPKGHELCTQKVYVDAIDTGCSDKNKNLGGNYFVIEVIRSGLF